MASLQRLERQVPSAFKIVDNIMFYFRSRYNTRSRKDMRFLQVNNTKHTQTQCIHIYLHECTLNVRTNTHADKIVIIHWQHRCTATCSHPHVYMYTCIIVITLTIKTERKKEREQERKKKKIHRTADDRSHTPVA